MTDEIDETREPGEDATFSAAVPVTPDPIGPDTPAAPSDAPVLIAAEGIRKAYQIGERKLEVLHGVDLELRHGEVCALVGSSGGGKSTLLHVLGLLERPTEGRVTIDGEDGWKLSVTRRAQVRNRSIGFVFQFYHLLPELDAVENVLLPAMISEGAFAWRRKRREYRARAVSMLEEFGLGGRLGHRPEQLSGGERQRIAIARALFHDPPLLIADEPTGNLDSATGAKVLDLLFAEQERRGLTLLLVTHDQRLARRCGRVLTMADGMILADSAHPMPV